MGVVTTTLYSMLTCSTAFSILPLRWKFSSGVAFTQKRTISCSVSRRVSGQPLLARISETQEAYF